MTGRFISADTVVPSPGKPQALNRYSYVYNNPLRFVDPTGMFTEEELLGWGVSQEQINQWQANDQTWWAIMQAGQMGDLVTAMNPYTSVDRSRPVSGRFALATTAGGGQNLQLSDRQIEEFRSHTNDQNLWRQDPLVCHERWQPVATSRQFMGSQATPVLRGRDPGLYFDQEKVNWTDIAWDGVGAIGSIAGANEAARALRYSNSARSQASV